MQFDPDNKVIQLCAEGMALEGEGKPDKAGRLFLKAWNEATNDFEKFTAAHYVARHQPNVASKLKWDETALAFALKIDEAAIKSTYPSLFLNIAKCYEDLNDINNAKKYYECG